jgi:hypothetical protein
MSEEEVEEWRLIKDFNDYLVSSLGRVFSLKTLKILSQSARSGYYRVGLHKNGKHYTHFIHVLVANTFLTNPANKQFVDHINGNNKDNRLCNLRFATITENGMNRRIAKNNTSGTKGVSFDKSRNKWHAHIKIDRVKIFIGRYKTLEEAKLARYEKAKEVFGEFINDCERI